MRTVDLPPHSSSLMESMRDIGYSMGSALADLIDNSITAEATRIEIFADTSGTEPKVAILDDGGGMTYEVLLEAMRLGTHNPLEERDSSDLGRFGLGLKTASLSQCRMMTVISKRAGSTSGARWDLDYVADTNEWTLQVLDDFDSVPWFEEMDEHGTLVVWENLGTRQSTSSGESLAEDLVRKLDEARQHLELTFHRFIGGDIAARHFELSLNGYRLRPFDPFNETNYATQVGPQQRVRLDGQEIVIRPYTLPHHSKVSRTEWDRLGGEEGYVKNQGFYVYRERRLIIHGTWFGLARQTELTKLARVRVDIPNSLDHAWRIDVKKSSVQLPPSVRRELRGIAERIVSPSKRIYTHRGRQLVEDSLIPVWTRVQDKGTISYHVNPDHPTLGGFQSELEPEQRTAFRRILEMAGAALPLDTLMSDFGADPNSLSGNASEEALEYFVTTTYDALDDGSRSDDDIKAMMQMADPFRSNWDATLRILEGMIGREDLE